MRRRKQRFRRERYLEPKQALRRLLRNSSFVREPGAVVRRAAMEEEGLFDTSVGGATDTDMWVRLFSRYGVRCLPQATCAYTIHEAAATTGMWNPGTIRANGEIFDRAVARGLVPESAIRRWQADWYHQFILAGAYRRLRLGTPSRGARGAATVRPARRPRRRACRRSGCPCGSRSRPRRRGRAGLSGCDGDLVGRVDGFEHPQVVGAQQVADAAGREADLPLAEEPERSSIAMLWVRSVSRSPASCWYRT